MSVVGPLSLHVEPERDNGKAGTARIRIPAFVIGQPRPQSSTVPASGSLALRFDGRATVTLALAGLPATTFGDPATGPAIATTINAALAAALAANRFVDRDGTPLTDPVLLAALGTLVAGAARYSPQTQQLAITSTPGTTSTGQKSSIELLPSANDLSAALGLSPPFSQSEGRQRIHRLPAPRPMTVECRLDLWSHTQFDMAVMFDGLANIAPTRGRLLMRPSLLAADSADGATQLKLLDRGEPTSLDSLVHLEGGDGLIDRVRGVAYTASAGAASDLSNSRFSLTAAGQLTGSVWISPLIPDPLFSTTPAPAGFAIALGLKLDSTSVADERYQLFALASGTTLLANLALSIVSVAIPGGDPAKPTLFGEITATALLGAVAKTVWRVSLDQLAAGGTLHATINGDSGAIALAWEGDAQRLDDPTTTPPNTQVLAPGAPALTADMVLALGGGAAAPLPRAVQISHLHVFKEPYGPIDPKLRTSLAGSTRLRPGDMIAIATSDDGWHAGEPKSLSLVDSVVGGVVQLTKPLVGAFARGRAVVYQDECFFFQTAVKRRDDLMNRLYHTSIDYRVSALLEDPAARSSAPLVLTTQENLTLHGAPRPAGGHPGVTAVDANPVRGVN